MTRFSKFTFILMTAALIAGMQSSTADARIVCSGAYQVFKSGGEHRSPLCESRHLAHVAWNYGMRVSAHAVHHNPSVKAEVCYTIGYDIRVSDICADYRPESNDRRKR